MDVQMKQARRPGPARAASRAAAGAAARAAASGSTPLEPAAQRMNAGPHAASLAGLRALVAQRACADCEHVRRAMGGAGPAQRAAKNPGGLPDGLRAGLERLSGRDLSGVSVHYDSPKPAQLNSHAFAQGPEIHVAPGQERHLPHEGWHAVQQMQNRVRPTMELGGTPVNDNAGLEREADVMGSRALAAGEAAQPRTAGDDAPVRGRAGGAGGVAQRCPHCGGWGRPSLPEPVVQEVNRLSSGPGAAESALALDRAYPRLARRAAEGAAEPAVQRAACGNDGTEWYTGNRGGAAARLAGGTGGMDIATDLAHILCCAFCEAMIRTWVGGGMQVGMANLRYTALFEHLVHQYQAQTAVVGGGTRNVYTEEAYWIPANAANFAALTGLAAANAYRLDQALWNAVFAVLNPPFNAAGGAVYPGGLPVAQQGNFDAHRGQPAAMAAAPANPRRRSYATQTIIGSGLYQVLRWISSAPGGGGGTAWDTLRDLAGNMRILDFAGERTPAGAATRHTVADAKFSYIAGHHDSWGPGQAADQQTIYQQISGGGPAASVPVVTWDRCGCNQILAQQLAFEKEQADLEAASGKRTEADLKDRASKRRKTTESSLGFIDSASVKWVS